MPDPGKSGRQLAEDYGYAYSFLKSDKSLWAKFLEAVKGNWTAQKFQAEVKTTAWYKKNADSVRAYQYLKTTNPGEFAAQKIALKAQLQDKAAALGATISSVTLARLTDNAMKYGWNESQIQNTLADYVRVTNGVYKGSTGNDIESVRQTAYRNGVKISKATENGWAHAIAAGSITAESLQRQVRQMAKSLAPGYAQELDAGMDLQDIVSPYIESKAKILEMNPADIDLFDNDIRKAVSGVGKDGKPASKTLWQFEQEMRQDPRWLKTQNSQDSLMSVGHSVLKDMGFKT